MTGGVSRNAGVVRTELAETFPTLASIRDDTAGRPKSLTDGRACSRLISSYFAGFVGGIEGCRDRNSNLLKDLNRCCQNDAGQRFTISAPI